MKVIISKKDDKFRNHELQSLKYLCKSFPCKEFKIREHIEFRVDYERISFIIWLASYLYILQEKEIDKEIISCIGVNTLGIAINKFILKVEE